MHLRFPSHMIVNGTAILTKYSRSFFYSSGIDIESCQSRVSSSAGSSNEEHLSVKNYDAQRRQFIVRYPFFGADNLAYIVVKMS